MTELDHRQVMETFSQLWPKAGSELNREQVNVYRMAFGSYTAEQVQAVLRDMAANSTKWPTPAIVKARLAGQRKPGTGKVFGRFDSFRERLKNEVGGIQDWSDQDCDLAEHKWTFEGAAAVYGPAGEWTIEYWRRWQSCLIRYGLRDDPLADAKDHAAMLAEYENHGGMAEAKAISDANKNRMRN